MAIEGMGGGGASAPPPPVLVIGGFLGSGKTSLILDFARWFTFSGGRLGILVNEAGTIGIDGAVLAGGGHRVREVFGGCVCCSLTGDLELGVRALAAYGVDLVVLEPSGMAEVDRIAALLETHAGSTVVVAAVIDAARFGILRQAAGRLLDSSVRAARFVIVNKVDAADESRLGEVRAWVRGLRPDAHLLEVSAQRGVDPSVWGLLMGTAVPEWGGVARSDPRDEGGVEDVFRSPGGAPPLPSGSPSDRPHGSGLKTNGGEVGRASIRLLLEDAGDPTGLPRFLGVLLENAVAGLGDAAAGHAKALARRHGGGVYASTTGSGSPVVVRQLSPGDSVNDLLSEEPESGGAAMGTGEAVVDLVLLFAGRTEAELTAAIEQGLAAVRSDPALGAAAIKIEGRE